MAKKILVVEDEEPLLKAICLKMEKMGVEVSKAKSADEARKQLSKSIPDVIWLDHYLFGFDSGLDLLKEIRSKSETRDIPVIVVSNTCSNDKYRGYIELGINKFYIKSSARLVEIIGEAVSI